MIESLESVKQIGLNVLDLLVLKLVKESPRKQQRRLSDCTSADSTLQDDTLMKRSLSSPVTSHQLNQVYQLLDTHHEQMNQQDYILCCSLAALLTNVYQLLELPTESTLEQLTDFELQRTTQGIMSLNDEPDIQTIWNELDHLMTIVRESLLLNPPTYDQTTTAPQDPPSYHSLLFIEKENGTGGERQDLNVLLEAIDRLTRVAPQLDNQRVQLNPTQVKELSAATLGKTVERLSKGRLESQRASLPIIKTKQHVLLDLIEQIQKSASRSLDNQRVSLNIKQQRQLDMGSLFHVLDKLDKGRFTNQVCCTTLK